MSYFKLLSGIIIVIIVIIFFINYKSTFIIESFENSVENIHTYIINGNKHPERFENTIKVCDMLHINNIERFEAIYPALDEFKQQNISVNIGQYGCTLSHIGVWKKIIKSNHQYHLILEDDIAIPANVNVETIISDLNKTFLDGTQKGTDFIYIGSCFGGMCTHAYIISKNGAEKLLHTIDVKSVKPIDHQIKDYDGITKLFSTNIPNDKNTWGDGLIKQSTKVHSTIDLENWNQSVKHYN